MKKTISFHENLKNLRKSSGLTRKALAEKVFYSEKSVEKWESGDATPPLSVICKLSAIFCVPLDTLVYKEEKEIKYYLGIDGGGTKTAFLLEDCAGNRISYLELSASNPNDVGQSVCETVIKNGVLEVCAKVERSKTAVFAGIAGGLSEENATFIKKVLSGLEFELFANGSDVENAIELALSDKDGIVLIAGTGIIGFSQINGKRRRCGGWGYLLDSAGSGYNFGRDALEAAFMAIDGRAKRSVLTEIVEKQLKIPLPDAIPKIYNDGKRLIASFAPLVFEAVRLGDTVAADIIRRNCKYITDIINCLSEDFESANVPVVICGGLASEGDVLAPYIQKELTSKAILKFECSPMVQGAVALARRIFKKDEEKEVTT